MLAWSSATSTYTIRDGVLCAVRCVAPRLWCAAPARAPSRCSPGRARRRTPRSARRRRSPSSPVVKSFMHLPVYSFVVLYRKYAEARGSDFTDRGRVVPAGAECVCGAHPKRLVPRARQCSHRRAERRHVHPCLRARRVLALVPPPERGAHRPGFRRGERRPARGWRCLAPGDKVTFACPFVFTLESH